MATVNLLFLLAAITFQLWCVSVQAVPTVIGDQVTLQVPGLGTIIGLVRNTTTTRDPVISPSPRQYFSFRSIPYAEPPVGDLRFRDPVLLDAWPSDPLNATREAPVCSQWHSVFLITRGREDCLYLNVYTPADSNRSLPVMVYFHGGAFYQGSGNPDTDRIGPRYLLTRDVVLVTVNYRLGPAGFFSLGDRDAPGNYGLLDQVAALEWVQKNIAAFNGNPNSVTIFGNSAGAASALLHVFSPRSRGLFHRVIAQSGSALCRWATLPTTLDYAQQMVTYMNCTASTTNATLDCLRQIPTLDLAGWRRTVEVKGFCMGQCPLAFNPRVDSERDSPFLPDLPMKLIQQRRFHQVPIISGMTSQEGSIIVSPLKNSSANGTSNMDIFESDPEYFISAVLGYELNPKGRDWAKQALDQYVDWSQPLRNQLPAIVDLATDSLFSSCKPNTALLFSKFSSQPSYFYYYKHRGAYTQPSLARIPPLPDLGVCHTDELFLLFSSGLYPDISRTDDVIISEVLLDLWTSFATTGTPTSLNWSVTWPRVRANQFNYLEINKYNVRVTSDPFPFTSKLRFWKTVYTKGDMEIFGKPY